MVILFAIIGLGCISWAAIMHHEASPGHADQMACTEHCVPSCSIAENIIAPVATVFTQLFTTAFISYVISLISLLIVAVFLGYLALKYRPPDLYALNCQYRF